MRPVTRAELLWTAVLGIVLVGSAFCLVDLHFQMRQLFVAHEHEMDVHRRLLDDQAELEMKVRRASLPGASRQVRPCSTCPGQRVRIR